jgi:hypothetical protein
LEKHVPTLRSLRYPRNQGWVRAVALFVLMAWLSSTLYTNCIKPPPAAHVAMAGCAQHAAKASMDLAKYMPMPEKCANKICYTALAGGKDSLLIEKLKASFDVLGLALAFFCAFLLVYFTQGPPSPYAAAFLRRRRRVPLIYQFCSLLN